MAASQIPAKVLAFSKQPKPRADTHQLGTLLTIRELAERLTVSVGCIRAWRLRVDEWLDVWRESRWEAG